MFIGCYSFVNEPDVFCSVHVSYLVRTCYHLLFLREMLSNLHFGVYIVSYISFEIYQNYVLEYM